jgi:hypothetical protein
VPADPLARGIDSILHDIGELNTGILADELVNSGALASIDLIL